MNIIQEGEGWRLRLVPDEVEYDDSYIDTWEDQSEEQKAQAKREIQERISQEGVWVLVGEVKCQACGNWDVVDSCSGFIGQDWKGSGHDESILNTIQTEAKAKREVVFLVKPESWVLPGKIGKTETVYYDRQMADDAAEYQNKVQHHGLVWKVFEFHSSKNSSPSPKGFLEKLSDLIAEHEKTNGTIIGCYLELDRSKPGIISHEWGGEKFSLDQRWQLVRRFRRADEPLRGRKLRKT